jgi:TetR/AcrR family transcriptional regulator, repressor for neighboring sulfatase
MSKSPTKQPTRKPRDAVRTRASILEAAGRRVRDLGPDGIRLADIAADVGVTHALILHHFGSRDGLIIAMIDQVAADIVDELVRNTPSATIDGGKDANARLTSPRVDAAFELLSTRGYGRLVAWALQQRRDELIEHVAPVLERLVSAMIEAGRMRLGADATLEWERSVIFSIRLVVLAAAGESIVGALAPKAGKSDAEFRLWLSNLTFDQIGF